MQTVAPILLLVALLGAPDQHRPGDQIVAKIEAMKWPHWNPAKENDKKWMDQYMRAAAEHTKRKNGLILDLYRKDPTHPRTVDLMIKRWLQFESGSIGDGEKYHQRVLADIDGILRENPALPIREAGEFARAMQELDRAWITKQDPAAIALKFFGRYPDSPHGEQLLMVAGHQAPPSGKMQLYRVLLAAYPNSKSAPMARGAVRQMEGVGKPFGLKFKDAATGREVDVSAMKGKVVLIDFWATWCGPCVAKMPQLKEIYAELKPRGLEVIGVSLDISEREGGLKKLLAYIDENNVPWPNYYQGNGWDSEFSRGWGIMSIPTVFLVDKKGILRSTSIRDVKAEVLRLLAED